MSFFIFSKIICKALKRVGKMSAENCKNLMSFVYIYDIINIIIHVLCINYFLSEDNYLYNPYIVI